MNNQPLPYIYTSYLLYFLSLSIQYDYTSSMNYIYVIHTREFISLKLPVYKIGKTKQELTSSGTSKRCSWYPKGSIQLALYAVYNCDKAEKHLIHNLLQSHNIIHCTQYGAEYFNGPLEEIFQLASQTALQYTVNPIMVDEETENNQNNDPLQCVYCLEIFSRKDNLEKHLKKCKEKDDFVRCLEIELGINFVKPNKKNQCRFCNSILSFKNAHTRHVKTCKQKYIYKEQLEAQVAEKFEF